MNYAVSCECGAGYQVSGSDAGTTLDCPCGREVAIPPLHVLRRNAGEASISPELMIESLLREGGLPEDAHCVGCCAMTEDIREIDVVCERPEIRRDWSHSSISTILLRFLGILGWAAGLFAGAAREDRVLGRNVRFRLPLRICPICASRLDKSTVTEMLARVPVYRQLLSKYPHSEIAVVKG